MAFDGHPGNARRVRVTINERTLADSFWPVLKRTGLAEGRDIGGRFEPNIMRAVKGLRLRPGECARRGRREAIFGQDFCGGASRQPYCNEFIW